MTGGQEHGERLRDLVTEYAIATQGELSQEECAQAEEHLAACPGCRERFKQLRAIADALRSPFQVQVPQEVLFTTRSRVMAAVRLKLQELALEEEEKRFRRRRLLRRIVTSAAAVLLVTAGVVYWFTFGARREREATGRLPEVAQTAPKGDPPVPRPVELLREAQVSLVVAEASMAPKPSAEEAVRTAKDAKAALALLEAEFERAKASEHPGTVALEEVVAAARAFIERSRGTREMEGALLLLSRCHAEMADPQKAQEAFLAYADALGRRVTSEAISKEGRDPADAQATGESATAGIILQEAARLFRERDKLMGVSYCDIVVGRYRGSHPAWVALVMVGDHYGAIRQPAQAIQTYQAVLREAPIGSTAWNMAYMGLPTALLNAGRGDEAVQALMDYARTTTSRDAKAGAYYNAGAMLALRGKHAQAVAMYRTAVERYPGTSGARVAQRALGELQKKLERDLIGF